ncbi:MAG: hypothetical protein BGO67_04425 [Alphaproteobacteria bacterium 41-28]|nr:MAG: hypothetical protein BGO67_04425 [Alphaproteobacteria bacterium 41-28]
MMDKNKLRQVDFGKLQNFYTLFREGSISKASIATGVTRRTYYYDLAVLEEVFETKLYLSGKKNFILTDEGKKLADLCKTILDSLSQVTESDSSFTEGNITIHTTASLGLYYFPKIIREFREKYPNITIELLSGPEYLGSKYHDFDITVGPYLSDKRDLSQNLLNIYEYGYFASEEYLNKYGTPKAIEDLRNHKMICYAGEHLLSDEILSKAQVIVKSNSYLTLTELCLLGLGICSLSLDLYNFMIKDEPLRYSKLHRVFPDYVSERDNIYFSFFKFTTKEKPIRDIFEMLKNLVKLEKLQN